MQPVQDWAARCIGIEEAEHGLNNILERDRKVAAQVPADNQK